MKYSKKKKNIYSTYTLISIPTQKDARGCLSQKETAGSKHKSSIEEEREEKESLSESESVSKEKEKWRNGSREKESQ